MRKNTLIVHYKKWMRQEFFWGFNMNLSVEKAYYYDGRPLLFIMNTDKNQYIMAVCNRCNNFREKFQGMKTLNRYMSIYENDMHIYEYYSWEDFKFMSPVEISSYMIAPWHPIPLDINPPPNTVKEI